MRKRKFLQIIGACFAQEGLSSSGPIIKTMDRYPCLIDLEKVNFDKVIVEFQGNKVEFTNEELFRAAQLLKLLIR